jgi:hypothetical protein
MFWRYWEKDEEVSYKRQRGKLTKRGTSWHETTVVTTTPRNPVKCKFGRTELSPPLHIPFCPHAQNS